MIGINLLPDVKKEFIKAQRNRNTVISLSILSMFIVGGLTVFLALFVYLGQGAAILFINNDIDKKQETLAGKTEISKYLTIQNQLSALRILHDDTHKILYGRLLDYLPQLNPVAPNNIHLASVDVMNDDKLITIIGSTQDFRALDTFKNTLELAKITYADGDETREVEIFSEVSLETAALSQTENGSVVSFKFNLTYSSEIFSPSITSYQLIVPKLTISDAQSNAPSQLFTSNGEAQ